MSAPPPPSFSSFPDLQSLRAPQQPSQKDRDRPSKRARRSVEVEEEDDERRRKDGSSSGRRRDRNTDDDGDERKDRKADRHGSHRDRETDREREKRKEKERSSSSSKHHQRSRPITPPPPPPPPPSAASTLFYKDTRGDEANKTYGSLHGPSVAKFYRSGGEHPFSFPFGFDDSSSPIASSLRFHSWKHHRIPPRSQDYQSVFKSWREDAGGGVESPSRRTVLGELRSLLRDVASSSTFR